MMIDLEYPANSLYLKENKFGENLLVYFNLELHRFTNFAEFLDSKKFFVVQNTQMIEFSLKGCFTSKQIQYTIDKMMERIER